MAQKVYLHVGLPKTGTTYLQSILWANEDELRRQGVLLPGRSVREHLWASGVIRGDNVERRHPEAPMAWSVLTGEAADWPGVVVISHEFFAAASAEQAARAIADLAPAEVHLVVTARDTLALVTARWQEFVKNGATAPIDAYPRRETNHPRREWDWGTMDLGDVLDRWAATLPPERVHVLTLPKTTEPRETLWLRFAALMGIDASRCDQGGSQQNESLGVVEVELLRRVNAELEDFSSPVDRGHWIRSYLAQGKLLPRKGEKFWPSDDRVKQLRARGDASVALVQERGYDVIGDLEDLRTPGELPERRHPDSVTDAEMLGAAAPTIAQMMADVRRLTREKQAAEAAAQEAARIAAAPRPTVWRRVRARLGRLRRRPTGQT